METTETVEFLSIVFRSAHHALWFKLSMTFLLGSVAFTVIALGFRLYDLPKFIGIAFGIPFLIISPMAAIKTKLGALNGPLWSVDCIWWNALVGGLILSLWALGHFAGRLEKKGIPRAE